MAVERQMYVNIKSINEEVRPATILTKGGQRFRVKRGMSRLDYHDLMQKIRACESSGETCGLWFIPQGPKSGRCHTLVGVIRFGDD